MPALAATRSGHSPTRRSSGTCPVPPRWSSPRLPCTRSTASPPQPPTGSSTASPARGPPWCFACPPRRTSTRSRVASTGLGYTRPQEEGGVWDGGEDLIPSIDPTLTPELQYGSRPCPEDRHLVLTSDTSDLLGVGIEGCHPETATKWPMPTTLVGHVGEPLAAVMFTGDFACSELAMSTCRRRGPPACAEPGRGCRRGEPARRPAGGGPPRGSAAGRDGLRQRGPGDCQRPLPRHSRLWRGARQGRQASTSCSP